MALQNTDYFLVNRAGASHRLAWSELQSTTESSLQIQDVFTYSGGTGATTSAHTDVPLNIGQGIRLPVAGTGDYNVDGAIRYSPSNSKIELYYGGSWNTASGGTAFNSTPPVPATEGDVWYDTDNGRAYVYYNDGTSSQWVEMNPAWDGGTPPGSIEASQLPDASIGPQKLTPGHIEWDDAGYHAIGQTVDRAARLVVTSVNSNNPQYGIKLIQSNSSGSRTQTYEVLNDEPNATSTIKVDNTGVNSNLNLQVGSSIKLSIPESGNITSNVAIQSSNGFVGNLTGDLTGTASHVQRNGVSSSANTNYRVLLGENNNTVGPTATYVVNNASRLYYNPSTDRLVCGTFVGNLSGTASNASLLDNLDSTAYLRLSSNNTVTGTTTFSQDIYVNDDAFFSVSSRHNDNIRANFGNSNDTKLFFSGSHFYTDLVTGNWYVRDNTTTRFTFSRTTGAFTATGAITSPTFNGALNGNANTATTASNSNLLGGLASSAFFKLAGSNTITGTTTFSTTTNFNSNVYFNANTVRWSDSIRLTLGTGNDVEHSFNGSHYYTDIKSGNWYVRDNTTTRFTFARSTGAFTATGTITAPTFSGSLSGNATSATNADKLDNINSTQFLRSDTADQKTSGTLRFNDNVILSLGSSDDAEFFCNGSHLFLDLNGGIGNFYIRDGSTTRFTFDDAGSFTATGTITAPTFSGSLSGNATSATTASNANLLDNLNSTAFFRLANSNTVNGSTIYTATTRHNDSVVQAFGNGTDVEQYFNGTHFLTDLNAGNWYVRDNTTTRFTFERTTGSFTATGNVTAYSDINLKENIKVIPDALNKVSQLRGVTYNRKDIECERQAGVIAQEVEVVLPEVVQTDEDGIKSVAYGNLVSLLVESTKELKAENDSLKARLEAIEKSLGL